MSFTEKIFKNDEEKYREYRKEVENHLKLLEVPEETIELMIDKYNDLLQVWKGTAHNNPKWEKGYTVTPQLAAFSLIRYYVENQKFQLENTGKLEKWLPSK